MFNSGSGCPCFCSIYDEAQPKVRLRVKRTKLMILHGKTYNKFSTWCFFTYMKSIIINFEFEKKNIYDFFVLSIKKTCKDKKMFD